MAVAAVFVGLQASRPDGRGVSAEDFLIPLDMKPGEVKATHAPGGAWSCGMIVFADVQHGEFATADRSSDAGAQTEAFFAGVAEAFRAAAEFLDARPPQVTAALEARGLSLRLFVEIDMDQDQMELALPPELLAACGRHRLCVHLISNDF